MAANEAKKILVSGGNSGIGLALCRQLVVDHGCHVFMGSRSLERGQEALDTLIASLPAGRQDSFELVHVDVGNDASVADAVESERGGQGGDDLRDESVEVGVGGSLDVEGSSADIVDGLVVKHDGDVSMLEERMGRERAQFSDRVCSAASRRAPTARWE